MSAVLEAPTAAPAERDRSKFLGGSDVAAVMGLSPWATPLELWQLKTRRVSKAVTPEQQKRFDRGHKIEPFIRDMAVQALRDAGLEVELVAVNEIYTDAEHSFLSCEIDFELVVTGTVQIGDREYVFDREHINADAKSVSGFARKKWGETSTEDVPIEYAAQFMQGLAITGRRFCLVAALRSFDDVDIFWTVRDDETITAMRPKLVEFWQCVLDDVPPDPLNFSDIKLLFPLDNGQEVEATEEIAQKVDQLAAVKARIKDLEDSEAELTFAIGEFISPAAILTYEGRTICTWKGQSTSRFDTKQFREDHPSLSADYTNVSSIRVLRISKKKA